MKATPSAETINEDFLCIMKYNTVASKVEIDYLEIENLLQREFLDFERICQSELTSLDDVIEHLNKDKGLTNLKGYYSYCQDVAAAYQGVTVSKLDVIAEQIKTYYKNLEFNVKHHPEKYDLAKLVQEYKIQLLNSYRRWVKAYSIQAAYELCKQNKNVLAFSHRLCGWSNPVHQLTKNFSVEIKTNFGYGSVSYFYSKLKFKNIDITPFSEWVDYEHSNFSEIIRYTRKYYVNNKQWLDAMIFCQDACNLSLSDEQKFVEVYIIEECEKMVDGLESILKKNTIQFKRRDSKIYSVDKAGRILLEFRGEKISGALDFITKILVLKSLFNVSKIVERIEVCNKAIQPMLANEIPVIEKELGELNDKMILLKPRFLKLQKEDKEYDIKREKTTAKMSASNTKLDNEEFEINFKQKYPLYESFVEEFASVSREYSATLQLIENTKKIHTSVKNYNQKIMSYLKNNR